MADFGVTEYMALAGYASAVAGAGVAAYSAHEQGVAQSKAAAYQAQVARNNQAMAAQYATMETQKGAQLEEQKRLQTAQAEGSVRAAAGASGLDPNATGSSPLRLQGDTAMLGEQDALTIRANAARAAYGYKVQGLNYGAQAGLDEAASADAARAGALGAFSSIIGGASSVSDKWLSYRREGVPGPWSG